MKKCIFEQESIYLEIDKCKYVKKQTFEITKNYLVEQKNLEQ